MTRPVVSLIRAFYQNPKVDSAVVEGKTDEVNAFLAGCWAMYNMLEEIDELLTSEEIGVEEYDTMRAQIELDFDDCAEELGLERGTPLC